jgi:hypothetical protein
MTSTSGTMARPKPMTASLEMELGRNAIDQQAPTKKKESQRRIADWKVQGLPLSPYENRM